MADFAASADGFPAAPESEFQRHFAAVQLSPNSFTAWTAVLGVVNKEPIETIRQTFDAFLARFPLCYGYWNQYAQCELSATQDATSGFQNAKAVYDRAVDAVTYSVENWVNYGSFMAQRSGSLEATRQVYQRAIDTCLYDQKCVQLFEAAVLFEQAHGQFAAAAKLYRQGIGACMPYVAQLWPAFCQFAALHDFAVLATEAGDAEAVPETAIDAEQPSARRDRLVAHVETEYKASALEGAKRDGFEKCITRTFFLAKPLGEDQLQNWRAYLSFEEREGNQRRIEGIYRRALIACALYAEFWDRFARWKASVSGAAVAVGDLYPAVAVHLPNRPDLQLLYAKLLECTGNVADARAVYETLAGGAGKGLVEAVVNHSNFERRHGNAEKGAELLRVALADATGDAKLFLSLQLATCEERRGKLDEAREVLRALVSSLPGSASSTAWLQYAAFEQRQPDSFAATKEVFQNAVASADLPETGKDELWRRYLDFLDDSANEAQAIVAAEYEYKQWLDKSDDRNNSEAGYSGLPVGGPSYDASKKRAASEVAQPVAKLARVDDTSAAGAGGTASTAAAVPAVVAAPAVAAAAAAAAMPAGYDYAAYYQQYYGAAAYGANPYAGYGTGYPQ